MASQVSNILTSLNQRVDRIASDNKNFNKITDNLLALKKENSKNLEIKEKDMQKDASKESTTKISPDAKKNVDIVSGETYDVNITVSSYTQGEITIYIIEISH